MLDSLSSLQVSLAGIGGLTLVAVVIYNYWTSRKNAPRQAEDHGQGYPRDKGARYHGCGRLCTGGAALVTAGGNCADQRTRIERPACKQACAQA